MSDIVHCFELAGESIPSQLDTAPPLCKHHYHMVYNAHKPTQTHCPTCGTGVQLNSRPCPDPTTIRLYLADDMREHWVKTTGYVFHAISKYWLEKASRHLQSGMVLYIAGALDTEKSDTAWFVSVDQPKSQPTLDYKSNAEKTDTRIWLHVHKSTQQRFYIMSPDTDVYHIALPLHFGNKEILNVTGSTQNRILSVSNLKSNLASDPDLSGISPTLLPQVVQTLYTVTGRDYTSFFSGIGKITHMKSFFQHAEFISGTNGIGSLADISLEADNFEMGFLSF